MKLGKYKGLEIGKVSFIEVNDEEVMNEINKMLSQKIGKEIKNGKSEINDIVNINFEGFIDGVPFDGGKGEKYDLELGSHSFIPGFEDQLVGYEKNSKVDVNVKFPEDYHAENLKGKDAIFKCEILEVYKKKDSQFDDEFAKEYNFNTKEELFDELKRQMNLKRENEASNEYLDKLMQILLKEAEIELDDNTVKNRIDEMVDYYQNSIAQYGMDFNTYLAMQKMTLEQFRDQVTDEAIESVKSDSIFNEIAKLENIDVKDDELNSELELYKKYYNMNDEMFNKFVNEEKNNVKNEIIRRKVSKILLDENN